MRLLQFRANGELSLTQELLHDIPPYAILSHTWNDEEVSFRDVIEGRGKEKPGYRKLLFCGKQARRDGLDYFWVDTCCVNKTSSVEPTDAINSMFRWYQDAQKCYVYLGDVSYSYGSTEESVRSTWESDFRKSKWFTRGWTLQELIAPRIVEFFSADGFRLGDKQSMEQVIHEITGLPIRALRGDPLSEFSIEERFSWAKDRHTTRPEDQAYSLLGLFDIKLPLLYGEGEEKAIRRLRKEIKLRDGVNLGKLDRSGDEDDHSPSDMSQDLEEILGAESEDSEHDDIESIFSESGQSMSSKSSVEMNPVRVSGIKEITRVLLSREDFKSLCTAAITNVTPEKCRTHIRGFLKNYGQHLDEEAQSPLQHQAATFIREVAGRIADELRWLIVDFNEVRGLEAAVEEKSHLEKWLSTIEQGWGDANTPLHDDDGLYEDESEDDLDVDTAFPNVDAVRDFLVSSNSFGALLQALDDWINTKNRPALPARQEPTSALQGRRIEDPKDTVSHNDILPANASSPTTSDKFERSIVNNSITESSLRPTGKLESFRALILRWVISIYLFLHPVSTGFERIRWRCSCNAILWGDFPLDNSDALAKLKDDLFKNVSLTASSSKGGPTRSILTQQPPSLFSGQVSSNHGRIDRPDTTSRTATALNNTANSSSNGGQSGECLGKDLEPNPSSDVSVKHLTNLTEVTVDKTNPTYFEVCTNVGDSAVGHFELDISQIATDGELFKKIWEIYAQSRGFGFKRLFLRPRDVDFVLFSISSKPAVRYSAGIHKRPQEYPPDAELQQRRYHYQTPKIIMPSHIFIHFLHRARRSKWEEHADDTWLKRLPKKLNESLFEAKVTESETNPDLVFGWGVHILDGPNHAVLGLLLSVGILITFIVSSLVLGIAKTQEQASGVGQYLIAIMVASMSAVYFKLQDQ